MQMTDDAIQQATLAKQASRETSRLRVILTAWEIEEAERHAELLRLLQCTNMQVYEEASDEASWFERFLSDRSLAQVQQDFNLNLKVYNNDLSSFATTDGLLNEIENHAEERDLVLSQEEFAKKIKALMVERDGLKGDGEESHGETDDSVYDSNTSECR
jgi:hypothetical protein